MPVIQQPIGHGVISWLGINTTRGSFATPQDVVTIADNGIVGDLYRGHTRLLSGHDVDYFATDGVEKGDEVTNLRQITIVSDIEVAAASTELGLQIKPGMLRENIVVLFTPGAAGLSFSKLPSFSRMVIGEKQPKVLILTEENAPCRTIANPIAKHYGGETMLSDSIRTELTHRRGQMAMVKSVAVREVRIGETFTIFPPM